MTMQSRHRIRALPTILLAVVAVLFAPLAEAIVVAPHHAFIDHGTRSGVLYVHNPGTEPEEVSISFVFGYPASDSAGNVSIRFVEEPSPDDPSLAEWIRAYPRRARVAPGQTRAIRLLARPPADLDDGEYWARAVVTSRAADAAVTSPDTGGVRVGVTLEVRTVVPITYRKGEVTTGLVIRDLDAAVEGDSLIARVGMARTGNAAFLGTLHLALRNAADSTVADVDRHVAVYRDLLRRVSLPVTGLPAGPYTLHVRLDTDRSDLDPENVLPAQPLEMKTEVRLP